MSVKAQSLILATIAWLLAGHSAVAENRPIEKLPADAGQTMLRLAVVPREIAATGAEHGLIAALTLGSVKGAGRLLRSTLQTVEHSVIPVGQNDRYFQTNRQPGELFRYSF